MLYIFSLARQLLCMLWQLSWDSPCWRWTPPLPGQESRSAQYTFPFSVLRIQEILVRIRIRGFIPLTNLSGSCYSSVLFFKTSKKNFSFSKFLCLYFLKIHLHNFSNIKSHKVTKQQVSMFFLLFLLDDRRIRIRITDLQNCFLFNLFCRILQYFISANLSRYFIRQYFIRRTSDSTVSEDAGLKPAASSDPSSAGKKNIVRRSTTDFN